MNDLRRELSQIQSAIRKSPLGEKLSQIERWQRFRTQETTQEWLDLLGPTAVVLSHQEYFVDFVILLTNGLSENERRQLVLATSVHDLGEAQIGDIASPDKKLSDEIIEIDFALKAILSLPLGHELIEELVSSYEAAIRGDDEVLHLLFKALEKTEYLDTAIHVYQSLEGGKTMEKGWTMISRVLALDLPQIIFYAEALPNIVGQFLLAHVDVIDEMFNQSEKFVTKDIEDTFIISLGHWRRFKSI